MRHRFLAQPRRLPTSSFSNQSDFVGSSGSRSLASLLPARVLLSIVLLLTSNSIIPERARAQGDSQMGVIDLDLSSDRPTPSYTKIQDETIGAFSKLKEIPQALSSSGNAAVPPFSDDMLSYLSAVYLYCAINNGTCPLVLNALLEVDLIRSKVSGQVSCPTMKRFWNAWVASDMEERHKFQVRTSHINAYTQFNTQTRPRYLRCEATIQDELTGNAPATRFFSVRYRSGSPAASYFGQMESLLIQLKERVPNVFAATGSLPAGDGATPSKPKGKAPAGTKSRPAPRR